MAASLRNIVPRLPAGAAIETEVARLELLRRLSMGAAHTMNNAFTAILGETLCLLDERKDDPVVAEACTLIQQEIERCARLVRSVALRVQHRENLLEETDLAALLRGVEPLLRETVSRAVAIACEIPGSALCVRGGSEEIELLVLLAAHRLVEKTKGGGALRVHVESATEHADLVMALDLHSDPAPPQERLESWDAVVGDAERAIAGRNGVRMIDGAALVRRLRFERV